MTTPIPGVKLDAPDPRSWLTPEQRAVLTYSGIDPDTASIADINKALTATGHNPLPATPAPAQPPAPAPQPPPPPVPPAGETIPASAPNTDGLGGAAVDAAKRLNDALEKNRNAINTADEQLADAILKATTSSDQGKARLRSLQQSIVDEVTKLGPTLDTPAGQQQLADFLEGKTSEILDVLKTAGLDSSSQGAVLDGLAARYTALDSHKPGTERGGEDHSPAGIAASPGNNAASPGNTVGGPGGPGGQVPDDPLLGGLASDPLMAGLGSLGWPALGTLGGAPGALGGLTPFGGGLGGGVPLGDLGAGIGSAIRDADTQGNFADRPDDIKDPVQTRSHASESDVSEKPDQLKDPPTSDPDTNPAAGPGGAIEPAGAAAGPAQTTPPPAPPPDATIQLPDGSTVTVGNAAVAKAGRAVLDGAAINDAFQQAGIALSPPGAPVTAPVSPSRLAFGDIGQYTDHRVMALDGSKVWLNGQVTPLEQLETGPNFLGWERPPAVPVTGSAAPASAAAAQPAGTK
jgi:hypothetical protein